MSTNDTKLIHEKSKNVLHSITKNTNTYIKQNRLISTSAYKKLTQFQYATLNFQNTFMLSKVLFVTPCSRGRGV